ncbi:hypothetical protein [Aeromonas media]
MSLTIRRPAPPLHAEPSYQALADNLDNDTLIARLLDAIPCP